MRRVFAVLAVILAVATGVSGCGQIVEPDADAISIYASFFPIYALADALMAGVPDAELHCLVQPQDGCLRAYQMSDWDLYLLAASADAVIMGGRGLESFESALFAWGDSGPAVYALLYNLPLYNQDSAIADVELESHLDGANPHLYLSVDGAKRMLESMEAALASMDPDYAGLYAANMADATQRLDALGEQMRAITENARGKRVILMNEALIYVAQDWELEVADWYDRESGAAVYDDELQALMERLAAAEADVALIERQAPQGFIDALEQAGFEVARLDVLSTHREGEGFDAYIQAQLTNAEAIREAFERAENKEAVH